jgi:Cu/Ag efflux protein CusF
MRGDLWIALCAALVVTGCGRQAPPPRQVELVGQILEVRPATTEVVIKHQDVKNFMPGMTMPFKVSDPKLLDGKQAGDLVTATLVVEEVKAYLTTLTKTGHTDLPPAAVVPPAPVVLEPGDTIKDSALIDQDGKAHPSSSWRGHRVALTFMYTRCPLPDFCPMMDRHFAAVQKALAARLDMADVRLVSMTLDPDYDTRADARRRPQALDVRHGRARRRPEVRRAVRHLRGAQSRQRDRTDPQPQDGRDRRRGPPRARAQRHQLDPGPTRCRPLRDCACQALTGPSHRRWL